MSDSSSNSSRLSGLTVTCHQCGGSSMVRLDRKEYRCTHCGAITVVSDDDADRLEAMLSKVLNRPATPGTPVTGGPSINSFGSKFGLGLLFAFAMLSILVTVTTHHDRSRHSSTTTIKDETTVPVSQVVMSSLQWVPDSTIGGNYVGLLYNHSGYPIQVPYYTLTLFRNGMKDDSTSFISSIDTLQPGEYEQVIFRILGGRSSDRYEVEAPEAIYRSRREIVPVKLVNPQFVHQQGGDRYTLVGIVQNTFTRPISGVGQLLIYGKDQQIIGSAIGYISEIRPGEKTMLSMDAWVKTVDAPIAAYEYLIDAHFR